MPSKQYDPKILQKLIPKHLHQLQKLRNTKDLFEDQTMKSDAFILRNNISNNNF